MVGRLLLSAAVIVAVTGCGAPLCSADRDCVRGRCSTEGRCVPLEPAIDAGPDGPDAAHPGDAGSPDGGVTPADAGPPVGGEDGGFDAGTPDGGGDGGHIDGGHLDGGSDGGSPDGGAVDGGGACMPNFDGVIARSEVPLRAGLAAPFRVAFSNDPSEHAPVDLTGTGSTPQRVWDFTAPVSTDERFEWAAVDPSGTWWEADFPSATYAAPLSVENDDLGVFQLTQNELLLLGVVSASPNLMKLVYNPPVPTMKFPLALEDAWTVNSTLSGWNGFLSVYLQDSYSFEVDAQGSAKTPVGQFNVLRLRTDLLRNAGGFFTSVRSFYFASECFGVVASVTSDDNEPEVEFTSARELWRIAP